MFASRSYDKELLDKDDISFEDIRQNMHELNIINTWLGGHAISIDAVVTLTKGKKKFTICEIGCGGGDNLFAIYNAATRKGQHVHIIGIDIKEECIQYAKSRNKSASDCTWYTGDYKTIEFFTKPDIIFSSLFCHHFTEPELVDQYRWMYENSTVGFFINDLQRNIIAYYSIKLLTQLFSSSYLVKNDAPLSVRRGFNRTELQHLFSTAHITNVIIQWKWAFRYLVLYKHE